MNKGALAVAILTLSLTSAQAAWRHSALNLTIEGNPVEVQIVQDRGGESVKWEALPYVQPYPAKGMSVGEYQQHYKMRTAVNANFFREDQPKQQIPIGLVIHEGDIRALPHRNFPSVGWHDGKLIWDQVEFKGTLEVFSKKLKTPIVWSICGFNKEPGSQCATLWTGGVTSKQKNILALLDVKQKITAGDHVSKVRQEFPDKPLGNVLRAQLPKGFSVGPDAQAKLTLKLQGRRHGSAWMRVTEAVSGSHIFEGNEAVPPGLQREWAMKPQPRTLFGVDHDGRGWLAVFDGRREKSRGISVRGAWNVVKEKLDAKWALNLDGGGSATLTFENDLLNRPSDGSPRPVAVSWGAK